MRHPVLLALMGAIVMLTGCACPMLEHSRNMQLAIISKDDANVGTQTIRIFVLDPNTGVIHSGTTNNSGNIHSFQWDFTASVPTK